MKTLKILLFYFLGIVFNISFSLDSFAISSFQITKKQARYIWSEHRESFYCGCTFDKQLNVNYQSCGYVPVDHRRAQKIEWEHIVPVSWFGHHRPCWKIAKERHYNPRSYCEKTDPIFRAMLNDLHNLVPAIGEVNKARSYYAFGIVNPKTRFNNCEISIDVQSKTVEPKDSIKGTIARAYLYMLQSYGLKQLPLSQTQYEQYRDWHHRYPPSEWEKTWDERVFSIRGTHNTFITNSQTAIPITRPTPAS